MSEQPLDYLAATDRLLELLDEAEGDYFGARLMRRGLMRQRERAYLDRLNTIQPSIETLDLALLPHEEPWKGAEVSLLATILSSLQEAVLAIAQSVRERPTLHGPITADIQEAVRLRVEFALPGSLRLRLVPASPELQQASLFDEGQETLLDESIRTLLAILESSVEADLASILERLASVGPRAATHLSNLTSALDRGNASLAVGWRSQRDSRSVRFDRAQSVRLGSVLKQVTTSEREVVVQGRLVGGSLIRRVFELETEDGSVLSGKVDEEVLGSIEELFGDECTAELIVTEASLPSGEIRETYRLRRLTP